MSWIPPGEAKKEIWDVIIVGSGVGGCTSALYAGLKNMKVLLITKRTSTTWRNSVHDVHHGKDIKPFLGDGLGGSSTLYGMVMERLEPSDFANTGGAWPESFENWQRAYDAVEKAFEVKDAPVVAEFLPLQNHFASQGFSVKRLPLACRQKPECQWCQCLVCEKNCKISAVNGPLQKALETNNVFLIDADALSLRRKQHSGVHVLHHPTQESFFLQAKHIVLSAGALRTPALLQPQFPELAATGRYLMRHLIDCYVIKGSRLGPSTVERKKELVQIKAWGTDAFYKRGHYRLGTFQSFGRAPEFNVMWEEIKDLHSWLQYVPFSKKSAEWLISSIFSQPIMATIIEDEAQETNRVVARPDGGLDIHYNISGLDREKIKVMRALVKGALGPYFKRMLPEAENNLRLAHACGTCRIGSDEKDSVVNSFGRVHGTENIWVADASVFPASSGKNPALTIAAHAFRMVEQI